MTKTEKGHRNGIMEVGQLSLRHTLAIHRRLKN